MFRNYLAAGFRSFARNEVYAGLTVTSLAIGFAAAILIALFVRDELTWEHFIPGYRDIYQVTLTIRWPGSAPREDAALNVWTTPLLKAQLPGLLATRAMFHDGASVVRRGDQRFTEQAYEWVDPNFFQVLPLPVVGGDPVQALQAPDGLVLTRATARKFFHRDRPIGETLLVDGHPMRVGAVIEDPPPNSDLSGDFYASDLAPYSDTHTVERITPIGELLETTATFVRLPSRAAAARLASALPAFYAQQMPVPHGEGATVAPHLVPISAMHLRKSVTGGANPGNPDAVAAIALVGLVIVVIAAMNFVTMMTARANRRAVEVGYRKAAGAARSDLIVQFLGEAMTYVAVATVLGVALAELALPEVNAFLQRSIRFDYLSDPLLPGGILLAAVVVGAAAGAYPALLLSAFRPAVVLRGGIAGGGSERVRRALVVLQFSALVALVVMAATISRQTIYALKAGSRLDTAGVALAVSSPCGAGFRDEVRTLPGVLSAACSSQPAVGLGVMQTSLDLHGRDLAADRSAIDFGFLELYGLRPLAGRFFQQDRPADVMHPSSQAPTSVVVNQMLARELGFQSPEAAVDAVIGWRASPHPPGAGSYGDGARTAQIIGIAPDVIFQDIREPIRPTFFYVAPPEQADVLNVKLIGHAQPATMRAIETVWNRRSDGPIVLAYLDQLRAKLFQDLIAESGAIAACTGLAITIAALGLLALSAFTAEQRTPEIGVRKAMGAGAADITRLMLWWFTWPVLVANLIAWPIAWWLMRRWLAGFAYQVQLGAWTFLGASAAAVLIAWATVAAQALVAARTRPAAALRYE